MKFHIKSSRRNRNRERPDKRRDDYSGSSKSSSSSASLTLTPSTSAHAATDPAVVPLRSCLRKSPNTRRSEAKQKLRFQKVHVREFEVTVGDNPSCSCGAPIGIGWKHIDRRPVPLDEFERGKVYVKDSSELVLTRKDREAILTEWGVPWDEIIQAVRANVKVKYQRRRTVIDYDRWEEMLETAGRKIKHAFLFRQKHTDNAVTTTCRQPQQCPISSDGFSQRPTDSRKSDGSISDQTTRDVCSDPLPETEPLPDIVPRRRSASEGDSEATVKQQQQQQEDEAHSTPRLEKKLSRGMSLDSETASLSTQPSEAGSHPYVIEFERSDYSASMPNCRNLNPRCYYIVDEGNADDDFDMDAYSQAGTSTCDGSFDGLTRDCSFWQLNPDVSDDGPRIRRLEAPVVICEQDDDDDFDDVNVPCRTPNYAWYGHPPPYLVTETSLQLVPLQQHSFPNTGFNVVEDRYNEGEDDFDNRYARHSGWNSSGFRNMAPPHNSTNWNWE